MNATFPTVIDETATGTDGVKRLELWVLRTELCRIQDEMQKFTMKASFPAVTDETARGTEELNCGCFI